MAEMAEMVKKMVKKMKVRIAAIGKFRKIGIAGRQSLGRAFC